MRATSTATAALAVVSTLGIGAALCSQAPPTTVLASGPALAAVEVAAPVDRAVRLPSVQESFGSNAAALAAEAPTQQPALVPLVVRSPVSALPTQLSGTPVGNQGVLRVAHLSPSTGTVDMYIEGPGLPLTKVASDVGYRALSGYLAASPGTYTLQARPAGAAASTPPALSANVEVGVRTAQTAAFVDVGPDGTPQAEVLQDGTQEAAPGKAFVRVVSAAAGVGPLSVVAEGGGPIASSIFYGATSPYTEVDARSWTMDVTTTSGESARATLPVTSTSVNTVVVTRNPQGDLAVTAVPDAAPLFAGASPAPAAPAPAASAPAAPAVPAPAAPAAPASPAPAQPAAPVPAVPAPAAPAQPSPSATATTSAPPTTTSAPPSPAPSTSTTPPGTAPSSRTPARPTPQGGVPAGFGGMATSFADGAALAPAPAAPDLPTWGAPTSPVRPAGLVVPGAKIDAPAVGNLGLDADGELQAPATPQDVGWFGSTPGDTGPAVLVGHVDSWRGPGVFWNLKDLKPGDPIDVPRSDGTVARFAVDRVETVDKDSFPTQAVYGPTAGPSLRLITCGGPFDRTVRSYEDNVIVFASPR